MFFFFFVTDLSVSKLKFKYNSTVLIYLPLDHKSYRDLQTSRHFFVVMSGQTPVTNMWDLRKPTLIRWWEDPEPLQDESSLPTTLTESPSARRAVSRWLSGYKRYEDKENKNDAVTTDDTGASKDGESTIVRVVDVDKEYDIEKKDSVDRNSIIKIKNDNIADKDINDRKDNRRNDENKKDNQCKCNKRRRQMKNEVSAKTN